MEIKTTYIAFDGKEFDDEDSCIEYEGKIRYSALLTQAKFYNYKGEELTLQSIINEDDIAGIVNLPTENAVKQFKELNITVTDNIKIPGFYFYEDTETDEYWHRIEDFPEFVANLYDSYRMAKSIKERLDNEN